MREAEFDRLNEMDNFEIDATIVEIEDYDGHWKGTAFFTVHEYGIQAHRTRNDAIRWNFGKLNG